MLLKNLYFLLNLGLQPNQSSEIKRRIRIINLLNLVTLFFLLIGLTTVFFLKSDFPYSIEILFIFLASISLYLSKLNRTDYAFLIFTINSNISIFFINMFYPFDTGAYLFYFPLIVSVILLNNIALKNKFTYFHFGISILFFGLYLVVDLPQLQTKNNLNPSVIKAMWYYNLIISALIIALISGLLNKLIAVQGIEIELQNKNLINAKKSIDISLKEKEILLAELHHRVKNNLAIISGLLNLQEDATSNIEAKQIISESKNRIMSMAMVHQMLFENQELKNISIGNYVSKLTNELFISYNLINKVIINEHYDDIALPINKLIPLGLIINEIITNSIKYVYKNSNLINNQFTLQITAFEDKIKLIAKDSGSGFLKNYNLETEFETLGIFLIKSLSEQIDGKAIFSNENGAKIELIFSKE